MTTTTPTKKRTDGPNPELWAADNHWTGTRWVPDAPATRVVGSRKGDLCETHGTVRGAYGVCEDCKTGRVKEGERAHANQTARQGHRDPQCDDPACVGDC